MKILKYSFLVLVLILLFSYGCRKDIKTIEEYYEYIDIHDYANDSLPLAFEIGGGIYIYIKKEGLGPKPIKYDSIGNLLNQKIYVYYKGYLLTGQEFDSRNKWKIDGEDSTLQTPFSFIFQSDYASVIVGWDSAFAHINRGSEATILIPPEMAYGNVSQSKIPPNSPLRFDVELLWLVGDPGTEEDDENVTPDPESIIISRMLGLIK